MRYRNHLILVLCLVVGLMVLTPVASAVPVVDEYEVIDLGAGIAWAVNDRGEVVGNGELTDMGHAFVWQPDGTMTDLHAAAGWGSQSWSSAYGINKHGEIVAHVCCGEDQTYYVDWDRRTGSVESIGITTELSPGDINHHGAVVGGEMGGAYIWTAKDGRVGLVDDGVANAVRINDHGQVLGVTSGAFVPEYPGGLHFVIRERDGSLTHVAFLDIGPPFGDGDINNRGQVVYTVTSTATSTSVGMLWDPKAGVTEYEGWILMAINDHGVMAGATKSGGRLMPVLVSVDGTVVALPIPDGWNRGGIALDVNNRGVAVGRLSAPDGTHAVVWAPAR